MSLDAAIEKLNGNTAVVTVSGPLALGTKLKVLDAQLQQLVSDGFNRMVLDLTDCPYMDSSGLGVLVYTRALLHNGNGVLRLCGVNDRISTLLKLTKTDTLLAWDGDRTTSIAALG
jgi:anti-sigma B factor antagonist